MRELKYSASRLHRLGGELREKDKLEESLVYETLALEKYISVKDSEAVCDTLQARFLTWKHLFLTNKDRICLTLAKKDAQASLVVAKNFNLKNLYSKCYFRLGEVYMLENNYKKAVGYYSKALKFYKGTLSEKGDIRYHLGEALYRANKKKKGNETMLEGLVEIEGGRKKVSSFLFNVWRSGCYGRLAELLWKDNPVDAKRYLKLAEEIIKSDPRLIIRKRQLKELKKNFKVQ